MFQTLACLMLAAFGAEPPNVPQSPFQERGYYITFMRMPTYDLAAWKRIVDGESGRDHRRGVGRN